MTTDARVAAHAGARRMALPGVSYAVAVAPAATLSLVPSVLPRPALVQGVLTALLVTAAPALRRLATASPRAARSDRPSGSRPGWQAAGLLVVSLLLGVPAAGAAEGARLALQVGSSGERYWLVAVGTAVLGTAALIGLGRGLRWVGRRLGGPRTLAVSGAVLLLLASVGPVAADAGWRALAEHRDTRFILTERSAVSGSVRTFVGVDEAPSPSARADLAVQRLEASGGLATEAVVMAIPTGSGWLNPTAVAAFESGSRGGVATVAVQGGIAPSWVEMFFRRGAQQETADALYDALSDRLATIPPAQRPRLYVYGESLGALVGQQVLAEAGSGPVTACGAVWAGVPGGASLGGSNETVHRNADDPVVHWAPSLLLHRPADWPAQAWVPGLSYLATSLDLIASRGVSAGHGHVYGAEQDWSLPAC
jgi:uncharacterized membrane protein